MPTAHPRTTAPDRAVTSAWLMLCTITVLSWWLAPGHTTGPAAASLPVTLAVIGLGALKGRLIIRFFMEVRAAPRWLQWTTDTWLLALWAAVLGIYLW